MPTSRKNPADLEPKLIEAKELRRKGLIGPAAELCREVLDTSPNNFDALFLLGTFNYEYGNLKRAEKLLRKAISVRPDAVSAYSNLGIVLFHQRRYQQALTSTANALAIDPHHAVTLSARGMILQACGRFDEALRNFTDAIKAQPDYADAHWNLGLCQLLTGDFRNGWREYEWRHKQPEKAPHVREFTQPLWLGKPSLKGKTILLHAEQGLGDTIQFFRYADAVAKKGARVILEVQPPLKFLLRGLRGIDQVLTKGDPLPPFDYHCPLLSLPLAFGTEPETIPGETPYINSDPDLVRKWKARLGEKKNFRVGISWSGSAIHKNDTNRSIALEKFLSLLSPGIDLISLQKEVRPEDQAILEKHKEILHFGDEIADFSDTAALMESVDLVLSVDTSVAHLAGALGKPVWILLSSPPDFRWLLSREDSPWYPSARLFRQPAPGDWDTALQKVQSELKTTAQAAAKQKTSPASAAKKDNGTNETDQETQRRQKVIKSRKTDYERWSDPSQLEDLWDPRAQRASEYIPAGAGVLDLGCGRMALEKFLPLGCGYIPCDLVARDKRTLLCDFNAGTYPDAAAAQADIITALGLLEYIFDPQAFLKHLRQWDRPLVISYCATEGIKEAAQRRSLGWVNDFSYEDMLWAFIEAGFYVQRADRIDAVQWLFRLTPDKPVRPEVKKVGVLSYANVGNFGDRLGYHLINDILPAHAEVQQLSLRPWNPPEESFDLLIVGIGNSLFGELLDKPLLSLVERSRHAIGIFGTQYRETLPVPMLSGLLDNLDHWYARYEDDVLLYGRGRKNVSHLGDWLVKAFPMTRPTSTERLDIGQEIWNDLPLDRTIQNIQKHKTVFSTRLHPLLCALTSAEQVGYREQREGGENLVSGKFRSLLIDIFGRTYPEEKLWTVDREKVLIYKRDTEGRIAEMRKHIHKILKS